MALNSIIHLLGCYKGNQLESPFIIFIKSHHFCFYYIAQLFLNSFKKFRVLREER